MYCGRFERIIGPGDAGRGVVDMTAILSPTIALEELARVLNVCCERSFLVTSRTALTQ